MEDWYEPILVGVIFNEITTDCPCGISIGKVEFGILKNSEPVPEKVAPLTLKVATPVFEIV